MAITKQHLSVTPEVLDKLREELRAGKTFKQVAEEWNVDAGSIRLIAKNHKMAIASPQDKNYTYFFYLKQMMIRGQISGPQMKSILHRYYKYRKIGDIDSVKVLYDKKKYDQF